MNKWILVKERVPEKSGKYLILNSRGEAFVGNFDRDIEDECCDNICGFGFGEFEDIFDSGTLGYIDSVWQNYADVVAWFPLPKLYFGVQEDE